MDIEKELSNNQFSLKIIAKSFHKNTIRTADISKNSKYLLTGSDDQTINLFKIKTGKLIKKIISKQSWILKVQISSTNKFFISMDNAGRINIYNFPNLKLIQSLGQTCIQTFSMNKFSQTLILASMHTVCITQLPFQFDSSQQREKCKSNLGYYFTPKHLEIYTNQDQNYRNNITRVEPHKKIIFVMGTVQSKHCTVIDYQGNILWKIEEINQINILKHPVNEKYQITVYGFNNSKPNTVSYVSLSYKEEENQISQEQSKIIPVQCISKDKFVKGNCEYRNSCFTELQELFYFNRNQPKMQILINKQNFRTLTEEKYILSADSFVRSACFIDSIKNNILIRYKTTNKRQGGGGGLGIIEIENPTEQLALLIRKQ